MTWAEHGQPVRWWERGGNRGEAYEAALEARVAAGEYLHGEADFVEALGVRAVLDAGCGTGRVARELARRGLDVVGVDIDPEMLAVARRKAPDLDWRLGDLATIQLGRTFDAVLLAGNTMIFLAPGTEGAVLANLARHLRPGGLLIAGFQLFPGSLTVARYDALAAAAGLQLVERWATWDRQPWSPAAAYALQVHRRPA
ncbi:MAG TPA: class I SAM-dependent methyltransferase [Chloroflexota bacterium]|jgi:SAM-dependent methyltransferase|nr:class I SAM-dependent methyltransferase [Chloroflexota bacterium]